MEVYGVIYQIYCSANGKVYIGQARDVDVRWETHLRMLRNNKHHNEHLQRAWRKYASSAFEWTIKCNCFSQRDMNALEMFYIKQAGENCFNATMGGEGCEATEEARKKMSASRSGPKNHQYGKPLSEDHRKKLLDANRGKPKSAESITKRTAARAANMTEETRRKLGDSLRGKPRSAESIAKQKATCAATGKPRSAESIAKQKATCAANKKPRSAESIAKYVATRAANGKPRSAEAIAKAKATRAANGKTISAETIAKRNATRAANKLRKAQALEAQ